MATPRALRLHALDNVMVAVDELRPGAAPAGGPPGRRAHHAGP